MIQDFGLSLAGVDEHDDDFWDTEYSPEARARHGAEENPRETSWWENWLMQIYYGKNLFIFK